MALRSLADAVLKASIDLVVPHYSLPSNAGLINSAILYPLTRAVFASRVRFPLSIDLGMSPRMAEQLASVAEPISAASQADALLWPVNEAVASGFITDEVDVGSRAMPQPSDPDINSILALVTGSLFADIETKAALWQRPRKPPLIRRPMVDGGMSDTSADVARGWFRLFNWPTQIYRKYGRLYCHPILCSRSGVALSLMPPPFACPIVCGRGLSMIFLFAFSSASRTINREVAPFGSVDPAVSRVGRQPHQCNSFGNLGRAPY